MPCKYKLPPPVLPTLRAVFNAWNPATLEVDTTSSVGVLVRVIVRRSAIIHWISPVEINTGFNIIDISAAGLQNGDEICVQVSNDASWTIIDEDCNFIPTPGITSTVLMPNLNFSFEAASGIDAFLAPNSGGPSILTFVFEFEDSLGNTGTITMNGTKAAFQSVDDASPWTVIPTTGANNIVTAFGTITVTRVFDAGFDLSLNTVVYASLSDDEGMTSVEDYQGITCALFADSSTYLVDSGGDVLTYLTI